MPSWQSTLLTSAFRARRFLDRSTGDLQIEKERAAMEKLAALFRPSIYAKHTTVSADGVSAEWITPPGAMESRVILYLHGGSYAVGSIDSHRVLVGNIAHAAHARALAIDYRLAPEHPHPAALRDTLTTYRWLLSQAPPPDHVIVAGDSAGGGLALATAVALREANEPLPTALVCLSPWTDLTLSGERYTDNAASDLILTADRLATFARWYLGEADPSSPLASPLYANLSGLPPILIQVGSDEMLLSDATRVAERAKAAGVNVVLETWEGMQHEWQFASRLLPEAREAIIHIGAFIQKACTSRAAR